MKRLIATQIKEDLKEKIVFITGPRQVGKTTLSQMLYPDAFTYLNFDNPQDRKLIITQNWNRKPSLIIFDEMHKMKNWKRWLKGIYDKEKGQGQFLVTGSAKLDTYKKVGDSLAGRYFSFRLYPLDLKELCSLDQYSETQKKGILQQLMATSGFPEPYLKGQKIFYGRWKKTHLDIILKQDIPDMENLRAAKNLEFLIELLRDKVGSPISYNSLAEDLQVNDKTIKRYLQILENSYVIFKVTPYSKKIVGTIKKQPKYYFFDIARVKEESFRFENLVALSLLKEVHYRQDVLGEEINLFYLRNKKKLEIDFYLQGEAKDCLVEAKLSDEAESPNFRIFAPYFPHAKKIQLVKNLKSEFLTKNHVHILKAHLWLSDFHAD
ncbi:MAG: ATP-binding protein [Pseudomonadota bacterium]